jgi:D-amino peptidase
MRLPAKSRVLATILLTGATTSVTVSAEPWTTAAKAKDREPGTHVLVIYDMEGLAGQDNTDTFAPVSPLYPQGQRLLTDDVNAVIAGLSQGGATAISVADGHGGSAQIDILTDQLDSRAHMVARARDGAPEPQYDGVVIVGMHAKTGSGGFAAHTWTAGVDFVINGHSLNEAEIIGLTYGERGIPVIFVSGDDRLGAELNTMPWIEYVTVKKATSLSSAELYPLPQVRKQLTQQAERAMKRLDEMRVMLVSRPVEAQVSAFPPADLQWLADMPGIAYRDQTVTFTASDAQSAYRGMQAIGTAAMYGYSDALFRALKPEPNAKQVELRAIAEWDQKWEASERQRTKVR